MITIFIFIAIALYYGFYFLKEETDAVRRLTTGRLNKWTVLEFAATFFLSGLLGLMVGILVAMLIPFNYEYEFHKKEELVSLDQGMNIDGGFVLGTGDINSNPTFKYFEQHEGGYHLNEANAGMSKIVYTDSVPTVIIKKMTPQGFGGWFGIPAGERSQYKWVFKVPKGTVKNKYEPQK